MALDWNAWKCPRGRVVVRFKVLRTKSDEKGEYVPIEGSALVLPPIRGMESHTQDAWKKEDERGNRGKVVALGVGHYDSDGNFIAPEFAVGDQVVARREYGTLLEAGEAEGEGSFEDRLFLWSEIGAWRKAADDKAVRKGAA